MPIIFFFVLTLALAMSVYLLYSLVGWTATCFRSSREVSATWTVYVTFLVWAALWSAVVMYVAAAL